MLGRCPDPIDDPEGYSLWAESNACETCHGTGEIEICRDGEDVTCACTWCNGSGIDPDAEDEDDETYSH